MCVAQGLAGRFEEAFTLYRNQKPMMERDVWGSTILPSLCRQKTTLPPQKPALPGLKSGCAPLWRAERLEIARLTGIAAEACAATAATAGWNGAALRPCPLPE